VRPLTNSQALLMLADHLPAQQFAIFRHDPDQTIFVLGVIAHQYDQLLHLALQTVQPPEDFLQSRRDCAVFYAPSRFCCRRTF